MNIRDEEFIQRYFERQMSNAEEQNFLIDVAARDDMRMAFRSQLELLKAVRRDKDALPGAASVRERTLSALGFAGVVLPAALAEEEAQASTAIPVTSGWRALIRKPVSMITGGLLVGSIATFSVMSTIAPEREQVVVPVTTNQAAPSEIRIETPAEPVTSDMPATTQTEIATPKVMAQKPSTANRTLKPAANETLPLVNKSEPATVKINKPKIIRPSESK